MKAAAYIAAIQKNIPETCKKQQDYMCNQQNSNWILRADRI